MATTNAMEPTACRLQTLAATALVKIEHCAHCGVVAVHLGAFSFRLDEAALDDIFDALRVARRRLHLERCHHDRVVPIKEVS